MKNVEIDFEKTLGDLFYIGKDEVYEYVDKKRTEKVIGYNYHLASQVQGDKVSVKVLGELRPFEMMNKVKLVNPSCKIYATAKNNFATVHYSISADDIVKEKI